MFIYLRSHYKVLGLLQITETSRLSCFITEEELNFCGGIIPICESEIAPTLILPSCSLIFNILEIRKWNRGVLVVVFRQDVARHCSFVRIIFLKCNTDNGDKSQHHRKTRKSDFDRILVISFGCVPEIAENKTKENNLQRDDGQGPVRC